MFLILSVVTVFAIGAIFVRLKSNPLPLSGVREQILEAARKTFKDYTLHVGNVHLVAAEDEFAFQIQIADLKLFSHTQQKVAEFPIVRTQIDPIQSILKGFEIETVEIVGAELQVQRDTSGSYNLISVTADTTEHVTPTVFFKKINEMTRSSPLDALKLVKLKDFELVYNDLMQSKTWRASKPVFQILRTGDVITATADISISTQNSSTTKALLNMSYTLDSPSFEVGFALDQMSTADLIGYVDAPDGLENLNVEISGSLNADVAINGALETLTGVLEVKSDQSQPNVSKKQISFEKGEAHFEYDKTADRLDLTQITADTNYGNITAAAYFDISRDADHLLKGVSGNIEISEFELKAEDIFEQPLVFDKAQANLDVVFAPFSVTLNESTLFSKTQTFHINGMSRIHNEQWDSAYFLEFDELDQNELLVYWPRSLKPKTRTWIKENINKAYARNGVGELQMSNGKIKADLRFDLEDANVRYIKTLPPVKEVKGQGHLTHETFKVDIEAGHVVAPNGDLLDVEGSTFFVPDITVKKPDGEIAIKAKGSLQSVLSLMDEKPFEYLKKSNLKTTLAEGQVQIDAKFALPLIKDVTPKDVRLIVKAELTDMHSSELMKNRVITSDKMIIAVNNDRLRLTGAAKMDDLSAQADWVMPIGESYDGSSTLIADMILNKENLRKFGVQFGEKVITGSTPARVEVDIKPGRSPSYALSSNIAGLGFNIASLNWTKAKKSSGQLSITGTMGEKFAVDSIGLKAAGMDARGAIRFNEDGSFRRADFAKLNVGNWLDAVVAIENTGQPYPKITVSKGSADLRNVSFAKGKKAGASMDVLLDRLVLSDGIVLTDVRAQLRNKGGLQGTYTARVQGGGQIKGLIYPQKNGTAADITADNAGAVLRSANLYSKANGGKLHLNLVPQDGNGHYTGTFKINQVSVKQDNILADILNSVSVIGLVQQLSGNGIFFETVEGQFELKPDGVKIKETSAVGASIGITLAGQYFSQSKKVKMEGVITPVYAINGTFERLFGKAFGRSKGEGLFSFVYNVSGTSQNPKITVNPLSVFAPGILREAFRTQSPEVSKGAVTGTKQPNKTKIERYPSPGDRK